MSRRAPPPAEAAAPTSRASEDSLLLVSDRGLIGGEAPSPTSLAVELPHIASYPNANSASRASFGELDVAVRLHRAELAKYGTSQQFQEMPFTDYCAAIADGIDSQLNVTGNLTASCASDEECYRVWEGLPEAPDDPLVPRFLPAYQDYLRPQGATTVSWVRSLPFLCRRGSLTSPAELAYTDTDIGDILKKLSLWAESVVGNLRSPPTATTEATTLDRLLQAAKAARLMGADPHVMADEMIAVALCTIELQPLASASTLPLVHGDNRSIYAVMNHVCRMSRKATVPGAMPPRLWNKGERMALAASLRLFAPIVMRVDTLLSRLPTTRRVLFRGVSDVPVASGEYISGRLFAWNQPSSASPEWDSARAFGSTIFTIHAHSTAVIDYLSTQPQEREAILPSYAVLLSIGALSPTLLRMLHVRCNVVTLRELGDEPPIDVIAAQVESQRLLARRLFDGFSRLYVEGRLSRQRPPVAPWQESKKLFELLDDFVAGQAQPPLLFLGEGGTGKTSAMLAAYCHLSQRQATAGVLPVLPLFIPLPQLGDVHDSGALDERVMEQLGVDSRAGAESVARRATIVLLLDSLDECNILQERRGCTLVDSTSFCATCCRIIMSCRAESAQLASGGVVARQPTSTWHVLPFDEAQVHAYVDQYAAYFEAGGRETLWAAVERCDPAGELRAQPITLSLMMLQHDARDSNNRRDVPRDRHVVVSPKMALYRRSITTATRRAPESLLTILQNVAVKMLSQRRWQIPLSEVLRMEDGVNDSCAAAIRAGDLPCRVDAMEPSAQFSFSHKTIAEYLAATALWERPELLRQVKTSSRATNWVSSAGLGTSAAVTPRGGRGSAAASFSISCSKQARRLPSRPTLWR